MVFNLPASTPMLEAALDKDALAEDNHVALLPPIRKHVRVQVALTNSALSELVDRALDATGLRAAISESPQLVIHHSDTTPGSNTWSLCWNVPEKATAYAGPFIIDDSHPLGEGLALPGVVRSVSPDNFPIGNRLLLGGLMLLFVLGAIASTAAVWKLLSNPEVEESTLQLPGRANPVKLYEFAFPPEVVATLGMTDRPIAVAPAKTISGLCSRIISASMLP